MFTYNPTLFVDTCLHCRNESQLVCVVCRCKFYCSSTCAHLSSHPCLLLDQLLRSRQNKILTPILWQGNLRCLFKLYHLNVLVKSNRLLIFRLSEQLIKPPPTFFDQLLAFAISPTVWPHDTIDRDRWVYTMATYLARYHPLLPSSFCWNGDQRLAFLLLPFCERNWKMILTSLSLKTLPSLMVVTGAKFWILLSLFRYADEETLAMFRDTVVNFQLTRSNCNLFNLGHEIYPPFHPDQFGQALFLSKKITLPPPLVFSHNEACWRLTRSTYLRLHTQKKKLLNLLNVDEVPPFQDWTWAGFLMLPDNIHGSIR